MTEQENLLIEKAKIRAQIYILEKEHERLVSQITILTGNQTKLKETIRNLYDAAQELTEKIDGIVWEQMKDS